MNLEHMIVDPQVRFTFKRQNATQLAWSFWLVVIICAGVALVLRTQNSAALAKTVQGSDYLREILYWVILTPLTAPTYATVGAIVASRRPANGVGWLCLVVGLLVGLQDAIWQYASRAIEIAPGSLPGGVFMGMAASLLLILQSPLPYILLLMIFPAGRFLARRWLGLAWMAGVVTFFGLISTLIYPTISVGLHTEITNPLGIAGSKAIADAIQLIGYSLLQLILLITAVSLVVRWRKASGEERQQLKWLVYIGAVIIVSGLLGLVSGYLPISPYVPVLLGTGSVAGTSIGIPLAIGIAMLRYRLYDIDVLINRTLVYGALTGILALIYLGGVIGLQMFFHTMTGQASQPELAIVGSTLAIVALFQPLRSRIQESIDRRFYRQRYDAERTLAAFSSTLREEVDLEQISERLVAVVEETMQPASVSLWLRQPEHHNERPDFTRSQ